jgi:oligopeptide/dipeptide ABC transporter ATP-binding protein
MTAATAPLLEVHDLVTRYPGARSGLPFRRRAAADVRAVDGVSLRVEPGQLVALVGESGCGKSTLAQTIMGIEAPAAGSVRVAGRELGGASAAELRAMRREAQLIFQDPYESLDPRFTVRRAVEEPLAVHRVGERGAERAARVAEALERAGLAPADRYLDRHPHELSGGQRQRVSIAAALALRPRLLIADEPVSMLDVSIRAGILELLSGLRADGMGILMITHDLSTAARYADLIAVMYLGRIVELGPAADVVARPQHPYTQALISVVPRRRRGVGGALSNRQILRGEAPDAAAVPPGCRFHPRCPVAIERCHSIDPTLSPSKEPSVPDDHLIACLLT